MAKDVQYGEQNTQPWWIGPNSRSQAANKQGVTYKKSPDYSKEANGESKQGIAKTAGDITNWLTDIGRNSLNFLGSGNAWLQGRAPVVGGNEGDMVFGRGSDGTQAAVSGAIPSPTTFPGVQQIDRRADNPDLAKIGYQDPYAGLIASLRGRSGTDQAMLAAIYNKAAEYIRGMQGDVSGIYDTAAKDYQAGNQAATNAINAGVEAARAGQTRQAQALGTADLIGNIAARNEDIGNNQAAATSNLAQLLATNLNANAASKTNALSNLLLTAQGTQNEGAQSQAAYARALAEKIANYEAQGIQAKNAYNSNMYKADLQAQQAAAKIASNEAIAKLRYSKMTAGDVANASAALMDAGTQMGLTGQALTDYVNNAIGQVRSGG